MTSIAALLGGRRALDKNTRDNALRLFERAPHPCIEVPFDVDNEHAWFEGGVVDRHGFAPLTRACAALHLRDIVGALRAAEPFGFFNAYRSADAAMRNGRMALTFGTVDTDNTPESREVRLLRVTREALSRQGKPPASSSSPKLAAVAAATSFAAIGSAIDEYFASPEARRAAHVEAFTDTVGSMSLAELHTALLQNVELRAFDDVLDDVAAVHGDDIIDALEMNAETFELATWLPLERRLIEVVADVEQPQALRAAAAEVLGRKRARAAAPALLRVLAEPLPLLFESAAHALMRIPGDVGVVVGSSAVTSCPHAFAELMPMASADAQPDRRRHCADCNALVTPVRALAGVPLPPWPDDAVTLHVDGPAVPPHLRQVKLAAGERRHAGPTSGTPLDILHPALMHRLALVNIGGGALAILGDRAQPRACLDRRHDDVSIGPLRFTRATDGAIHVEGGADLGRGRVVIVVG